MSSSVLAQALPIRCVRKAHSDPREAHATRHAPAALPSRRNCLLLLTAATALNTLQMPSKAADIPLFGLRQGLRQAEKKAEELVKEGFETVDKGVVAAEKGIEAAEKGVEAAEKGIETAEKGIETARQNPPASLVDNGVN
ncbi:Synechocystis YCF37 [Forsythia ovata]|uniref:Synechocystis YCF37 n=1 Tax=Forsythia ovata TaxID=205694 RepID=A0ABD1UCZ3_9LAMI